MTDWAAKVLAGVPRYEVTGYDWGIEAAHDGDYVLLSDVLAAIARMGAGDGLVERAGKEADDLRHTVPLSMPYRCEIADTITDLLARIAALTAQVADHEKAAQENDPSNLWRFWANRAKEIADNNAALRERVARLEGALQWCSGSQDFQVEGFAREGWVKLCKPLLDAALTDEAPGGGEMSEDKPHMTRLWQEQVDARLKAEAERDAANALLRETTSPAIGPDWCDRVDAHLGAKP